MCFDADDVFDLPHNALGIRRRQIDLVQHRQNLEALVDGRRTICNALRLDTLRGIDNEQCAFAGSQRSRDFVGEIDVSRCIDEIQLIVLAVLGLVHQRHALCLDGNAAFPFQIHRIEHLIRHFAIGQATAMLNETVGKRRLAVVDVRDDREVANSVHVLPGRPAE